jgi:baculoviral IAP repeat-containing protein 6 (apollon)
MSVIKIATCQFYYDHFNYQIDLQCVTNLQYEFQPVEEESDQNPYLNSSKPDVVDYVSPGTSSSSSDLIAYQPVTLTNLRTLQQLTKCVNLTPCFTANAPACWSEMMQAQKQRRHPQHLQQGGEELHHTRTWRLQHEM